MHTCWECGREMKESLLDFDCERNGDKVEFKAQGLSCECGYKTVSAKQMDAYNIAMADAYRKKHGLLTTKQLLDYRELLGMSQRKFADFLCVGEKSVKRWEHGQVQEKSMDNLIKLKMENLFAGNEIPDKAELLKENLGEYVISSHQVADYVVFLSRECGEIITNMMLQKFVYYIQAWFMAFYGRPLFHEKIEAWTYGPVQKDLYNRFKSYGSGNIDFEVRLEDIGLPEDIKEHIKAVIRVYGKYSAFELLNKTHNESPWKNTPDGDTIDINKMGKYYRERLKYLSMNIAS